MSSRPNAVHTEPNFDIRRISRGRLRSTYKGRTSWLEFIAAVAAVVGLFFCAVTDSLAQDAYPNKVVRIIVPFPAGGVMDPLTRSFTQPLAEALGQQVLVDNRPGATGTIGLAACAKSPPNGYTLCMISSDSLSVVPNLFPTPPYQVKDFTAIAQLIYVRAILVANVKTPFSTFRDMVSYAKANPGKLNFASFGEGSAGHQALELIKNATGIQITHVPYKGAGPAIQAAVAGEVELSLSTPPVVLPHIRTGRLKPLALPGEQRLPVLPEVPTYRELGIDLDLRSWFGLIGPANIPREIVTRLNTEIVKIVQQPAYREKFVAPSYYETSEMTGPQFSEFLQSHSAAGKRLADMLKASGMKQLE